MFYPGRETCLYERLTFLWQWSAGLSLRSIARRSGRSPDTVRRWLRWWERCGRLVRPIGGHKYRYSHRAAGNGGRDVLSSRRGGALSMQPYPCLLYYGDLHWLPLASWQGGVSEIHVQYLMPLELNHWEYTDNTCIKIYSHCHLSIPRERKYFFDCLYPFICIFLINNLKVWMLFPAYIG